MSDHQIVYAARIEAPAARRWEVISDFGNISNAAPQVTASRLTSSQSSGVGATRHCDLSLFGSTVEERIVEWNEGRSLKIDIYESKRIPLVGKQSATFVVEADGDGSRVTATLDYEIKYGPFGGLMHAAMLRRKLDSSWLAFVAGIKHFAETGEPVEQSTQLPVAQVSSAAYA